jgi:hypothetical protein
MPEYKSLSRLVVKNLRGIAELDSYFQGYFRWMRKTRERCT